MGSFLDSVAGWVNSDFWAALLVDASLKGALALLAAAAVVRFFRPNSASFRHLVRSLALLALVALPVCKWMIPTWQVEVLQRSPWPEPSDWAVFVAPPEPPAAVDPGSLTAEPATAPVEQAAPLDSPSTVSAASVPDPRAAALYALFRRWETLLTLVWAAGAALILGRMLVGVLCVQYAVWRSSPMEQDGWESLSLQVRRRLNLRRRVRLRTMPGLEVALSVGVVRSIVLLPEVARTWSAARRRSILLHEFSHVKRWDNLTNVVSQLACALHWFNPLVWSAARQLTVDRERACDDEVLAAGTKASDYAGHLLEIARALSSRRLWGGLEVSQSSALKDRLHAVLDPRLNRGTPSFGARLLAVAFAAVALVPLAALQPWSDSQWVADAATPQGEGRQGVDNLRRWSVDGAMAPAGAPVSESGPEAAAEQRRREYHALLDLTRPASLLDRPGPARVVRTSSESAPSIQPASGWAAIADAFKRWSSPAEAELAADPSPVYRTALFRTPGRRPDGGSGGGGRPEPPVFEAEVARLDLGTLGGAESKALDINDLGFVVGESRSPSNLIHPFLWTARTGMVDLGGPLNVHTRAVKVNRAGQALCETFNSNQFRGFVWTPSDGLMDVGSLNPEAPYTQPRAMNQSGVVVGESRDPSGRPRAFIWTPQDGIVDLGVPGDSVAWAVNDLGQVAGYTEQSFQLGVETKAFFWDPEQGLHFLRPEGAPLSIATALNNRGQVVGYAEFADGYPHAFLWSLESGMIDLGTADPDYPITLATGINDLGQVVGRSIDTVDPSQPRRVRAFRWAPETGMEDIGSATGDSQLAINAVGQVVGAYVLNFDGSDQASALLWTEAGSVELKDAHSTVVALNNRNQAVGSSLSPNAERHAFLWEIKIRRSEAQSEPARQATP